MDFKDIRAAILSNSINDVEYRNQVLNLIGAFLERERLEYTLVGVALGVLLGIIFGLLAAV